MAVPGSSDFRWSVPVSGFEWARVRLPENGKVTELLVPRNRDGERRERRLQDHPDLFSHLADLESAPAAFVAFSNRYGLLGQPLAFTRLPTPVGEELKLEYGEPLHLWAHETASLRSALKLWAAVEDARGGDEDLLGELLRVHAPHGLPSDDDAPVLSALRFVAELIDTRLAEHTMLRLTLDDKGKRPELRFGYEPRTLLGALWLQFSEVVTGQKRIRYCAVCGRPIEVSARGARKDKDTCSDGCRQQKSRANRANVQR